jgi:transcription antitermination factor NusG
MGINTEWHIWAIKPGRFNEVKNFLETEVDGFVDLLYPKVKKEFISKNRVQIKTVPLYMNYIYIELDKDKYETIYHQLKKYSFTTTYVGKCTNENIEEINKMKGKQQKLTESPSFYKGDKVIIIGGPLKGNRATVQVVKGNKATLEISIFKRATTMDGIGLELLELEEDEK